MSNNDAFPVSTSYLLAFIEALALPDQALNQLLERAGLSADLPSRPVATLSLPQLLKALRWIDARALPGWHIRPTLALDAAHHGPLGVAVVTASSVAEALDTLVRFEPTRAPWTLVRQQTVGQRVDIGVIPVREFEQAGELLMEINLIALAGLIAQLLGHQASSMVTVFPSGYRAWDEQLQQALPGRVRLAGTHWQISLPSALLQRRCLRADPGLHQSAVARCEALLQQAGHSGPLAARVRQHLVELEGRSPGVPTMASELGLSPRSLIRQLGHEGTSYREQVDQVRRTLARDLLLVHKWPIARIAEQLGYADPANFGRAFRRWHGCSPGQLRLDPDRF